MGSLVVVGDVHGCIDELLELEASLADRLGETPFFVFVGDLVDRGPASASVVQHVANLVVAGRGACVLGNHDDMFVTNVVLNQPEWAKNAGLDAGLVATILQSVPASIRTAVFRNWYVQGGEETLESYGVRPTRSGTWEIDAAHIAFLAALPLYWENDTTVVTHAVPDASDLATLRGTESPWRVPPKVRESILWNRDVPAVPPDPQRLHISGHTPRSIPLVQREAKALQIDTGCVYGNALTAYIPAHDTFVQVSSRQA